MDLMSVAFGLLLAALAVGPNLIGVYLPRRAPKGHGAPLPTPKALAVYPPPVPFNYPLPVLQELPRESEGLGTGGVDDADAADWWKGEGGQGP